MKKYCAVFENADEYSFLFDIQTKYSLLVSHVAGREHIIYDRESNKFFNVFANTEEEAIRAFIEWDGNKPMVYDEEKNDYVPLENFSNHFNIYNEPIYCDWVISGK